MVAFIFYIHLLPPRKYERCDCSRKRKAESSKNQTKKNSTGIKEFIIRKGGDGVYTITNRECLQF